MSSFDYVIFASYGNDSLALIRWAYEKQLQNVAVVYSDTGWSADWWPKRVRIAKKWVKGLGFQEFTIKSEGMESLAKRKKAWPRGGGGRFQFFTKELKELPAMTWLDKHDPEKETICMIGIRRQESANRSTFPEHTMESERHGGRDLWAPLVRHSDKDRNKLLEKISYPELSNPLPHRSKECYPCVNANKSELKLMDEKNIIRVEKLEQELGINSKGNPRVIFSPKRHNGAVGIREVVRDAQKHNMDFFESAGCDGGWCGS